MNTIVQECLNLANHRGYRAQIFTHTAEGISSTYKNLTGEVVIQREKENRLILTLEKNGQKASRKYALESEMNAEVLINEVASLLNFSAEDSAEVLPEIRDTLENDTRQFDASAMEPWVKEAFDAGLQSLQSSEYNIETLIVAASQTTLTFCNTFGAKKVSKTGGSSISLWLNGTFGEESNTEWLSRDSQWLLTFNPEWTSECTKKLSDKLHCGSPSLEAGAHMFAMAPELASEMMGEFLGLLSGYAIAEHMTPFKIEEIGTAVLPDWATIESLHTGKDLSSNQFFDGNGITTTDLTLVKDGVLKELFLSKAAAERLNLPPNGQAGPINVVLKGIPPKTDLTGAKFLFTFLAGMHTMDSATGNFALEGEGYEIREDGSLGNFIKNVGLSGNIKQLFATMLGTLHDTPDYGSIRMPTLIFAPRHITPPTPLSE